MGGGGGGLYVIQIAKVSDRKLLKKLLCNLHKKTAIRVFMYVLYMNSYINCVQFKLKSFVYSFYPSPPPLPQQGRKEKCDFNI